MSGSIKQVVPLNEYHLKEENLKCPQNVIHPSGKPLSSLGRHLQDTGDNGLAAEHFWRRKMLWKSGETQNPVVEVHDNSHVLH